VDLPRGEPEIAGQILSWSEIKVRARQREDAAKRSALELCITRTSKTTPTAPLRRWEQSTDELPVVGGGLRIHPGNALTNARKSDRHGVQ